MKILCIDPGNEKSGAVIYDGNCVNFIYPEIENERLLAMLPMIQVDHMVIEGISHYGSGMSVGKSVFDTCEWIGRFIERFPGEYTKIYRREVKIMLCNSMKAKDKNIRQAILDRFPATGGGKTPQIGIKKQPGPLYGVSRHAWSALAVGITYFEQHNFGRTV